LQLAPAACDRRLCAPARALGRRAGRLQLLHARRPRLPERSVRDALRLVRRGRVGPHAADLPPRLEHVPLAAVPRGARRRDERGGGGPDVLRARRVALPDARLPVRGGAAVPHRRRRLAPGWPPGVRRRRLPRVARDGGRSPLPLPLQRLHRAEQLRRLPEVARRRRASHVRERPARVERAPEPRARVLRDGERVEHRHLRLPPERGLGAPPGELLMTSRPIRRLALLSIACALLLARAARAADQVGTVAALEGSAEASHPGEAAWTPLAPGAAILLGDELRTAADGKLKVLFRD